MFQDGFIFLKIRLKITQRGKIVPLLLWKTEAKLNLMYSLDSILLIFLETSTRKFRHVHMYVCMYMYICQNTVIWGAFIHSKINNRH